VFVYSEKKKRKAGNNTVSFEMENGKYSIQKSSASSLNFFVSEKVFEISFPKKSFAFFFETPLYSLCFYPFTHP